MWCLFCDVLCIVCVYMCTVLNNRHQVATQLQLNISYQMRGMQQERTVTLVTSLGNKMSLRLAISLPAYYTDFKQKIQV
jgi:hypothetical protein